MKKLSFLAFAFLFTLESLAQANISLSEMTTVDISQMSQEELTQAIEELSTHIDQAKSDLAKAKKNKDGTFEVALQIGAVSAGTFSLLAAITTHTKGDVIASPRRDFIDNIVLGLTMVAAAGGLFYVGKLSEEDYLQALGKVERLELQMRSLRARL